jgi:hypothetical protein
MCRFMRDLAQTEVISILTFVFARILSRFDPVEERPFMAAF